MATFKAKPEYVEAEQWNGENGHLNVVIPKPYIPSGNWSDRFDDTPDYPYIQIQGSKYRVEKGDYIVTYPSGWLKVMKPHEFVAKFDKVNMIEI
jgi:hypothetical protein